MLVGTHFDTFFMLIPNMAKGTMLNNSESEEFSDKN